MYVANYLLVSDIDFAFVFAFAGVVPSKHRSIIQSIMGDGPIQPVIQPVTINTMLANNGLNIPRYSGLNFVTCEQTFRLYFCAELSDVFSVNLNKT